jgi:large subunit ribosomal protein L30
MALQRKLRKKSLRRPKKKDTILERQVAMSHASYNGTVSVTLIKSLIGKTVKQKACIQALGLRKIGHTKQYDYNNKCLAGMIDKVSFMLDISEVEEIIQ